MDDLELYRRLGMDAPLDRGKEADPGPPDPHGPEVWSDHSGDGAAEYDDSASDGGTTWDDFVRDESGRIKLDYDSPLESFLTFIAVIAGFAGIAGIFMSIGGEVPEGPFLFLGGAVVAVLTGWLRAKTDCYWFLDTVKRQISFHRRFLSLRQEWTVGGFDQVCGVGVQAAHKSSKNSSWWEYWTVILLRDGRLLQVADSVKHEPGRNDELSGRLATFFGVPLTPAKLETPLAIQPAEGGRSRMLVHQEKAALSGVAVALIIFVVVSFVGLLLALVLQ